MWRVERVMTRHGRRGLARVGKSGMAMTYGGQTQVGQFFTAVARGFVETRFEIILFFLIVIAFLVVMIVLFAMQKRQADRDLEGRARRLANLRRRRYFRRKVRLPVLVARDAAAASRQTTLLDLSGGGASLRNPWELLRRGDTIRMSFAHDAPGLTVAASVVRVSRNGTAIHVKFEALTEAARDRILELLRGGRPSRDSGQLLGDRDGGDGPVRGSGGDLPVGL